MFHGFIKLVGLSVVSELKLVSCVERSFCIDRTLYRVSFTGNKNGNRRTANIRSVGYSDLFVLSKEDLWEALQEYPEARLRLLEKGRQMLRKDNLLDEEVASRQELAQLSTDEKLTRLEKSLEESFQRLTALTESFNGVQQQFKQRITKAERQLRSEYELVQDNLSTQRLTVPQQY